MRTGQCEKLCSSRPTTRPDSPCAKLMTNCQFCQIRIHPTFLIWPVTREFMADQSERPNISFRNRLWWPEPTVNGCKRGRADRYWHCFVPDLDAGEVCGERLVSKHIEMPAATTGLGKFAAARHPTCCICETEIAISIKFSPRARASCDRP